MTLSKLEIQLMLREMKVKFHADETYEALEQRLQQENHSLWLKSVSGERSVDGRSEKRVIRKRKKVTFPEESLSDQTGPSTQPETLDKAATRHTDKRPRKIDSSHRSQPIERPAPGKPWKAAADGTEPFNRKKKVFESVLRRTRKCCELCGKPTDDKSGAVDLEPFHILPLSEGGEHSIKNVVALCPACLELMLNDPDPKVIKELKRKTRTKIYGSLQVVKKKTGRGRKKPSNRRK